jgi:hypothetical protein
MISSTAKVPSQKAAAQTYFTVAPFHAEVDHHEVHIAPMLTRFWRSPAVMARIRASPYRQGPFMPSELLEEPSAADGPADVVDVHIIGLS